MFSDEEGENAMLNRQSIITNRQNKRFCDVIQVKNENAILLMAAQSTAVIMYS